MHTTFFTVGTVNAAITNYEWLLFYNPELLEYVHDQITGLRRVRDILHPEPVLSDEEIDQAMEAAAALNDARPFLPSVSDGEFDDIPF